MSVLPERTGVSSLPCGFGLSSLRHHCPRGLLGTSEMTFCLRMSQGCRLIGRRHCVMEDIGLTRAELGQRSEWMLVLRGGPRDAFPWVICCHAFAHWSVCTEFLLCASLVLEAAILSKWSCSQDTRREGSKSTWLWGAPH